MSAAVQPMRPEAFLAWEAQQDLRHEFDGVRVVAMTGGTVNHTDIAANLITALRTRLRGRPCKAFGGDLKVLVGASYRYPDALITCSPQPGDATLAREPVVVFEITSPSSAYTDRFTKSAEYRATPSIQRYVLLEQDHPAATVFTRLADDWIARVQGAGSLLALPEAGIEVQLDVLYEGLALAGEP